MNRIAIISDIHGNIPALQAVLEDIIERDVEETYCLGDLVGKGPQPAEAVDLVRQHCSVTVMGNWDYLVCEREIPTFSWHNKRLGHERIEYLKNLPVFHELMFSGKVVRLCHASPHDIFYRTHLRSEHHKRLRLFEPVASHPYPADVIGYGDIHGAHVDFFEHKTIFNTGSVGNPLEITQASYAIIEGELQSIHAAPMVISIVRVPYDIDRAVQCAVDSDMPDKHEYIDELRTGVYRGLRRADETHTP